MFKAQLTYPRVSEKRKSEKSQSMDENSVQVQAGKNIKSGKKPVLEDLIKVPNSLNIIFA